MNTEIARQGPFAVLEGDAIGKDYLLSGPTGTAVIGFDEEEIADLEILAEKINE